MSEEERRQVLEMVQSGTITAEQGLELLQALQADDEAQALPENIEQQPTADDSTPEQPIPEDQPRTPPDLGKSAQRWRNWWWVPLWVGVAVTALSGLFMFLAYRSSGFGFWFACTWFPFLLGVAVMAMAAASRTAPWLHVRIRQKEGDSPRRIAFSFPIPLRLTRWFLRTFRHTIPGLDSVPNMDKMLDSLKNITPEAPFFVQVDEEDGEQVEVYIG